MSKSTQPLSSAQTLILSTAAERPDRMAIPLPTALRARGAGAKSLLVSLIKRSLLEEVLTDVAAASWRQSADGEHFGLRLTDQGLVAVSGDEVASSSLAAVDAAPDEQPGDATVQVVTVEADSPGPSGSNAVPGGKLGAVLAAVTTPAGATIEELISLTGWLPHTTRAALTRLKQRGHPVALVKHDDRKSYRIVQVGGA